MDLKILGSILLIVGTSIGAGMLALPVATAALGFTGSLIMLFSCWFVMTTSAFLLLEVNLAMPPNSNLVTMARATIGPIGQIIAWLSFLLLLYSLLSAYISGGSGLLQYLADNIQIDFSPSVSAILFTFIFGMVVYLGMRAVDYVNRGLMLAKLIGYVLLMTMLLPFVSPHLLAQGEAHALSTSGALMMTITSFGFSIIVPSLRLYLASDIRKLKKVILIGSLVPLFCYIIWDMVIMGVLPLQGEHGLLAILHAPSSTSALVTSLTATVASPLIAILFKFFTSICILTSFLGVSLCLTDFLADGLALEKRGRNRLIIQAVTFLPPLAIVLIYPNAFIAALEYAGIYCVVLLILLPAWMVLCARRKFTLGAFTVWGGRPLLYLLIGCSFAAIAYSFVC